MDAITTASDRNGSPELFRLLADNIPQLAWIADRTGYIFWYNRQWFDFTGTTLAEMEGWGWQSVHHPDEVERVTRQFQQAITSGQSFEDIFPLRRHDGAYRQFLTRAQPIRDEAGEISHWFGSNTDVTDQVAAERKASYLLQLREVLREADSASAAQQAACELLRDQLGADRVLYSLADPLKLRFEVVAEYVAPGVATVRGVHEVPLVVFDRMSSGQPYVTNDWTAEELLADVAEDPQKAALPVRALIDVPHLRGEQLLGWLSIHQQDKREWTAQEVELAVATAERTWSTVERARAEAGRDQAEQALKLALRRLEAVLDNTRMAVFLMDDQQRCTYANAAAETLTGFTIAEMKDQRIDTGTLYRRSDGSICPVENCPVTRAFTTATRTQGEVSFVTRDGSLCPVAFAASPVLDDSGKAVGLVVEARSIAEEQAAQRALAQSEAQFRTLAEALPGMLFVATAEGGNSYVNETFATFSGLSKDELLGTGWEQLLHPDDRQKAWGAWQRAVETGTPYEVEYRFRRHDGNWRWIAARALRIPSVDEAGREMWVGTSTDIHDARMADQEVAAAEARYRAVFEQAGVGVARVSPDGPFLEINDRYCEILRRSREELLGNGWKHITHPEDLEKDVSRVEAMLRGELDGYSIEKRYLATDGSEIWVNLTVAAERDENGKVLFFIPVVEDHSARKEAEAALRASEERYRTLFESMEQGFCTIQVSLDAAGRPSDYYITELNPAFTRHTGLPQDVLHKSVREAVPGLEQNWFDRYGEVAVTGQASRFIDYAEPLGRWFEVYAFQIGRPEERNVALLFSDVTDRIEQEEALRQSEQELRLRLNAIPQMVWTTLPDGYHDFYNDRWYEFTGTTPGSTDGEEWTGMFHPEDQPLAWQRWQESLATGQPYEIEYRLRHHDGTFRWVLGRALPIRNDAGEIVRWMGTCTDIDDRIAAAHSLQESEARLRAVIEAMPVGLVFADSSGRITGGNRRVTEIIGHDLVESVGISDYGADYVAFHSDGRPVASDDYPLAQVIAGAERAELECQLRRPDGTLGWVRYEAAPIVTADGTMVGGVVASLDIDREKRLTESLGREVEKVIAEREAAQEALRQSQKLEAMGQLTGGVAHDFNNLLTPIIGSLDLLQRKQILDDRTGRLVEGALASAEKARVLVQRLLAFARRQPLKPQPIDLTRVIAEMSDLINSTSGPRVRVLTDVEDGLPAALADGNQLEMALLNLSVNARDAMPEGGTLTIAARTERGNAGARLGLADGTRVVLGVSDTGVGMDEDTRRRAIEPFFSTKGIGKGTGLGLSMVHGLAAQLGGALDIRSAPGMGTTIELWLPLADDVLSRAEGPSGDADLQGAGTVLLVDDEELVRASTAGMLADLGYRVVEADNGEAAMALVAEGLRPDLLVTDQLMPGLSGTDLAMRLRERFTELPVLIVSGYADLDSLSPAFPHLSKPFRHAELAAALDKVTP